MARLRGYLVRATYDWLVHHNLTPYFLVDAEAPDVNVPHEYVEEGKIVLNAAPEAVRDMDLDDAHVAFEASFSGEVWDIFLPIDAVLAVYSQETSQGLYAHQDNIGMMVNEGDMPEDLDPEGVDDDEEKHSAKIESLADRKAKIGLRVIK
jgi:stringent starvation protein B